MVLVEQLYKELWDKQADLELLKATVLPEHDKRQKEHEKLVAYMIGRNNADLASQQRKLLMEAGGDVVRTVLVTALAAGVITSAVIGAGLVLTWIATGTVEFNLPQYDVPLDKPI